MVVFVITVDHVQSCTLKYSDPVKFPHSVSARMITKIKSIKDKRSYESHLGRHVNLAKYVDERNINLNSLLSLIVLCIALQ